MAAAVAAISTVHSTGDGALQLVEIAAAAVVDKHIAHSSRVRVAHGSKAEKMNPTVLSVALTRGLRARRTCSSS